MLRRVTATRYVIPLREGGSLPAIVEGGDLGTYVLKFRGAGQGRKALIVELVGGELARCLGLSVPEIVFMDLDPEMARAEPDPEIQDLVRASAGLNLALDYLPGSLGFDPLVDATGARLASSVVWFDALVTNIDRTPRNPNLLMWHGRLWLIDHGASLYFHHAWRAWREAAARPFAAAADHVLLPFAADIAEADGELAPLVTEERIRAILALIPDEWLEGEPGFERAKAVREAYLEFLMLRLQAREVWVEALREAYSAAV